jgi:hypothetical protein
LRACIHRDKCACVVSVSDVLCNSKKNLINSSLAYVYPAAYPTKSLKSNPTSNGLRLLLGCRAAECSLLPESHRWVVGSIDGHLGSPAQHDTGP